MAHRSRFRLKGVIGKKADSPYRAGADDELGQSLRLRAVGTLMKSVRSGTSDPFELLQDSGFAFFWVVRDLPGIVISQLVRAPWAPDWCSTKHWRSVVVAAPMKMSSLSFQRPKMPRSSGAASML
jgi:hypothetical protein